MGSLGLEFISKTSWGSSDIDIHVPGDPRGWEAPGHLRIYNWGTISKVMEELDYELIDLHEHEFQKNDLSVEYGSIDSLYNFAGIRVSDLDLIQVDGVTFRLPTLRQFLKIYQASSKDSYRNDNNNKDFKKIDFLKKHI